MKFILTYLAIVICSFTISGCKFDEIKSVATTGEMSIVSDENLEPLMSAEVTEFQRLNPEAKIKMKSSPTKNAVADLINSDTKFIVIPRNLSSEEREMLKKNNMESKEFPIAIDGIAFIVNPKNPVTRVTSDDLQKIFTGQYLNWTDIVAQDEIQNKEVKSFFTGADNKIKLFIQRKNSSTFDFVFDSILKKVDYSKAATVCSTSAQMKNSVRENINAIGIVNMSWLAIGKHDTLDSTLKALRVSKVWDSGSRSNYAQFHQGLIYTLEYPYRRTIYAITTESGISLSTGFISFLTKTDGQKIVLKEGLVPVSQPVRTVEIN